ncbi:hypothetical protein PFISCL1PPCAC_19083, partial [Pristionchus fissidentatus]
TDSILLDEFDLATMQIDLDLCSENDCKVYVTAPKGSLKVLDNMFIGDTSLGSVARSFARNKPLKLPLVLKKDTSIRSIVNRNAQLSSAPVAVYV